MEDLGFLLAYILKEMNYSFLFVTGYLGRRWATDQEGLYLKSKASCLQFGGLLHIWDYWHSLLLRKLSFLLNSSSSFLRSLTPFCPPRVSVSALHILQEQVQQYFPCVLRNHHYSCGSFQLFAFLWSYMPLDKSVMCLPDADDFIPFCTACSTQPSTLCTSDNQWVRIG